MDESRQSRKYRLGLAGEFLVTGELLRRGIQAAITYGNAKKADVIAVYRGRAISIEVKTTQQKKWIIGGITPQSSDDIWVFVYIPKHLDLPTEFYVLKSSDMYPILNARDVAYQTRYREKHDIEFTGRGVVSLPYSEVESFKGAWSKIEELLKE